MQLFIDCDPGVHADDGRPACGPAQMMCAMPGMRKGEVLITGGMGALGLLVARWLGQHQPQGVTLLGRSGRVTDAHPPDLLGDRCLHLSSCDLGTREDAAHSCGQHDAPWSSVVHAGRLDVPA